MKNNKYRRFYWISLAAIFLLSAYPFINGIRMLALSIANGALEPEQLTRYVVPYAAICAALLLYAAMQPALLRLRGRWVFPASAAITYGIFFAIEQVLENIQINSNGLASINGAHPAPRLDMWQAMSCYISPEAIKAAQLREQAFIGENGFYYVVGNSAYKLHYYLISLVLIVMACGLVYGIGKALQKGDASKKQAHILQGTALGVLVIICIFANMTGFFRTTAPIQTPLASILTALFFVLLGAAAGIYAGSFMLDKKRGFLPPACAMLMTVLMYAGEAAMMDGELYRFGTGWFFTGLPVISLAPVDILIVLMSGAATWLTLWLVKGRRKKIGIISAACAAVLLAAVIAVCAQASQNMFL